MPVQPPTNRTATPGINLPDVLVRTAIMDGLQRLRNDPKLLDFVFGWLPNDALTAQTYGLQTLERAKQWFLATDIPVSLDLRMDQVKIPVISLTDDSEDQSALGETHHDWEEPLSTDPTQGVHFRSAFFRQGVLIGCYANGEPETALNLYAIVKFILLKYRKELLEARGYERTTISGTQIGQVQDFNTEVCYARHLTLTGFVRDSWPADFSPVVTEVGPNGIYVLDGPKSPSSIDVSQQLWGMQGDEP
jgi:hypothetical protein